MLFINRLTRISVVIGIMILISGCGEPPVEVKFGDTFSNNDNQFKVLTAERFTQSRKNGEYIYYDEVIFVLLEWKCLRQLDKRCTSGGSYFSLYDKTQKKEFENITYKQPVIDQYDIVVTNDMYNCCDRIGGGDVYQVYLLFAVGCNRDLVIKYYNYLAESYDVYYLELPEEIQCNR
jgi:hypothetical protein